MAISQITMESQKQCIFCNLASERIIAENELCLAIRDGFPVSEGHTLIIPKRHVADYFDLTSDEIAAMQTMMKEIKCHLMFIIQQMEKQQKI